MNSYVKIEGKMQFNEKAWLAGIEVIGDLFVNGKMLDYHSVIEKYGVVLTWYEHLQLIDAIPILWKQMIVKENIILIRRGHNTCIIPGITARNCYTDLIMNDTCIVKKRERWERILNVQICNDEFLKLFKYLNLLTVSTKARDFQYRLLMHTVVTNRMLTVWGVLDSDLCSFCGQQSETYTHLFYSCSVIKPLWLRIKHLFLATNMDSAMEFSSETVLFNLVIDMPAHVGNLVILLTKMYIYQCRCANTKPSMEGAIYNIDQTYLIEEHLARTVNKWNRHVRKWRPLRPDLEFENINTNMLEVI